MKQMNLNSLSVLSLGSYRSILCLASAGSILSIGSTGSILSIGSAGSILSIGSVGSILSFMSAGSILSVFSVNSTLSFLKYHPLLWKWEVRSGEWEVGSGQWRVGSGQWGRLISFIKLKQPPRAIFTRKTAESFINNQRESELITNVLVTEVFYNFWITAQPDFLFPSHPLGWPKSRKTKPE